MIPETPQVPRPTLSNNNQTSMGKLLIGQMLKKRQQKKMFTPTLTPTQTIPTKPFEQKHPNLIK